MYIQLARGIAWDVCDRCEINGLAWDAMEWQIAGYNTMALERC